jgi:hypothetical protein
MTPPDIKKKQFSIGEILSLAWQKYTDLFQTILVIILIIYIPINIILGFVPIDDSWEGILLYYRVIQLLEGFIGIIATMAIAFAVKQSLEGKRIEFGPALKKALFKWPYAFVTNLILGIFLLGLFLLLIVPGIIFYVFWMFTLYVVVLKDIHWKSALDYSRSIVKGRWWTVFGYSIVFGLISLGVALGLGIITIFVPETYFTTLVIDTVLDIMIAFFTVVYAVFFINFDYTKMKETAGTVTKAVPTKKKAVKKKATPRKKKAVKKKARKAAK